MGNFKCILLCDRNKSEKSYLILIICYSKKGKTVKRTRMSVISRVLEEGISGRIGKERQCYYSKIILYNAVMIKTWLLFTFQNPLNCTIQRINLNANCGLQFLIHWLIHCHTCPIRMQADRNKRLGEGYMGTLCVLHRSFL